MSELKLKTSIHNRFDIEVRDAKTGELKQKAEALNVICDGLWDILLSHDANNNWRSENISYNQRIVFGTGTGTPSSSDTSLFNYLGYKTGTVSIDGTHFLENVWIANRTIVLNPEEYVGEDLTEVGIGTSSILATHALIKDLNGNTISIHKTDTDVITIISSIYVHFNNYFNGSIVFDYDEIIDPDTGTPRTDNYLYSNAFFSGLCGLFGIYSFRISTICPKVNGIASYSDSHELLLDQGSLSMIVDYSNKRLTINFNRLQANIANDYIHRAYRISVLRYYAGRYHSYGTLLLLAKNWYNPLLITQESIGTGDGTAIGFSTKFPIKTIDKVYIDGVQETNYSYVIGPTKPYLLLHYMPRIKKHGNIIYYVTSSYEVVDEYGYASHKFESPLAESSIYENIFYSSVGIKELRIKLSGDSYAPSSCVLKLLGSNDLETWVESSDISGSRGQLLVFSLPSELKDKRYYKIKAISYVITHWTDLRTSYQFTSDFSDSEHNIVFQNPPSVGSVVTVDYTPDCIAKDENHVFDLSLSISFNESQAV